MADPIRRLPIVAVLFVVMLASVPRAQAPSAPSHFDVVSVKPNKSGFGSGGAGGRGGRFVATNATPLDIIEWSFQLEPYQVLAAPAWVASERFDATGATDAATPTYSQLQEMTRALLEDRFKLKAHHETRPLEGYSLVRARSQGPLGSDLTKSPVDCAALQRRGEPLPADPPPRTVEDFSKPPTCGVRGGNGLYAGGGVTMSDLAAWLKSIVHAPVTDRTGLDGPYVVRLRWNPDPNNGANPAADSFVPSIFVALQDQLGLKLDRRREPTEVLVIDSIERPTPD